MYICILKQFSKFITTVKVQISMAWYLGYHIKIKMDILCFNSEPSSTPKLHPHYELKPPINDMNYIYLG